MIRVCQFMSELGWAMTMSVCGSTSDLGGTRIIIVWLHVLPR
jgi:hypothetical protein